MAQGKIIISTEDVKGVSRNIEELAVKYHDAFTELYALVDSLAESGMWQGVDNAAYVQQINGFKDDFARMEALMVSYADFLKKAAEGYKTIQNFTTDQVGKKLTTSV